MNNSRPGDRSRLTRHDFAHATYPVSLKAAVAKGQYPQDSSHLFLNSCDLQFFNLSWSVFNSSSQNGGYSSLHCGGDDGEGAGEGGGHGVHLSLQVVV